MREWRFHWALRQFDAVATFALIIAFGALALCLVGSFYDLGLGDNRELLEAAIFFAVLAVLSKFLSKALHQVGQYIDDGSSKD